jgi:hypothetical protein
MLHVREYGHSGPRIFVLHGGPGAPGHMAPVARGLAGSYRVLERSSEEAATKDSRSQGTWRTCMRSSPSMQEVANLPCWARPGAQCSRSRMPLRIPPRPDR